MLKTRHTEGTNTKSYMKAMIRSKIQKGTKIETEGKTGLFYIHEVIGELYKDSNRAIHTADEVKLNTK